MCSSLAFHPTEFSSNKVSLTSDPRYLFDFTSPHSPLNSLWYPLWLFNCPRYTLMQYLCTCNFLHLECSLCTHSYGYLPFQRSFVMWIFQWGLSDDPFYLKLRPSSPVHTLLYSISPYCFSVLQRTYRTLMHLALHLYTCWPFALWFRL